MRVLLVGGSGFIGKSFLDAFKKNIIKKYNIKKIIIISRNIHFINKKFYNDKKIEFKKIDISKAKSLPKSDLVFYLSESTITNDYKIINLTKNHKKAIDNFCKIIKNQKKTKVIYCSSGSVYKNSHINLSENNQLIINHRKSNYKNTYAQLKLYSEKKIRDLGSHGIKTSIARCFTFIGPSLPLDKHYAIGNFINDGFNKKKIFLKTRTKVIRSYMYADDLVIWLIKIVKNASLSCPIYNVGSDKPIDLLKLANIIAKIFKKKVQIGNMKNTITDRYIPNTSKVKNKLKLKLNYNLKQAIILTINSINEKTY